MYATAHRVRSPDGEVGINAFLHEHGPRDDIDWAGVSISRITDSDPGKMVAQSTELAPGRNAVLSYLDVMAPDGTTAAQVQTALRMQGASLLHGMLPSEARTMNVSLRFGATFGLQHAAALELEALAQAVVTVIRDRPERAWISKEPLEIQGSERDGVLSLSLASSSLARLPARIRRALPSMVSVDLDVKQAFDSAHGQAILYLIPVLTGLSLNDVAQLGGVRLIAGQGVVWEWPPR